MYYADPQIKVPSDELYSKILDTRGWHQKVTTYGRSGQGNPLIMITQILDSNLPTLMIVAGTHGDEVAGVHAAANFWREESQRYFGKVNLIYYPCVNPDGFNAGTRLTTAGLDLNREFHFETRLPEAKQLMHSMCKWGERVDFLLHLHEDDPTQEMDIGVPDIPKGAYLYLHGPSEGGLDNNHTIASQIIAKWKGEGHIIHEGAQLYGAKIIDGVIDCTEPSSNHEYREVALLDNLVSNGERCYSLTVETVMLGDLAKRIAMQREAIETTIEHLARINNLARYSFSRLELQIAS